MQPMTSPQRIMTTTRLFSTTTTTTPSDPSSSSTKGWNQLGLVNELLDAVVTTMGLEEPTQVQQMVIPQLLQSQSLAFLSATGSGKTLAYCLPLLQLLKVQEQFEGYERRPQRPRLLVLAPTRELVAQIHSVVKALCHSAKLSSAALLGGEDAGKQRRRLAGNVDIVVTTPGRLLKHWTEEHVFLGEVTHVVVDEMDTMLEQGFENDLKKILYPVLYHKQPKQSVNPAVDYTDASPKLVLTSATLTQAVQKLVGDTSSPLANAKRHYKSTEALQESASASASSAAAARLVLPQLRVLQAPGLHKAVPLLKQAFVNVGTDDKLNVLVDQVLSAQNKAQFSSSASSSSSASAAAAASGLTMIFCNSAASCRAVQFALQESGVPSLACHGELNSAMRMEQLSQFRKAGIELGLAAKGGGGGGGQREEGDGADVSGGANSEPLPRVLVCTDLVARGLDVLQVSHVIMFDFPLNALDYLHRIGRTARASNAGWVTSLVTKRDQVLASAIKDAVQRGEPLDGLSSRKSDYLPGGRLHKKGRAGGSATSSTTATRRKTTANSSSTSRNTRSVGSADRSTSTSRGQGQGSGPSKPRSVGAKKGKASQVAGRFATSRSVRGKDAGSGSTNSKSRSR
jgi:superfamily II DNA/RNA helicase